MHPSGSRPRTPSTTVHHLLRPALSSKSSISSLNVAAKTAPVPVPPLDHSELLSPPVISSASSLSNGIVADLSAVHMSESEQGDSEDNPLAEGHIVINQEAQQQLREQLRRTLSRKAPVFQSVKNTFAEPILLPDARDYAARQYYVLTDAGKPVFIHRSGSSSTDDSMGDDTAAILGVIQAIVSVFADNGDKLRFINTQSTRIAFLLRTPLYLVSVGTLHEPEAVARLHLDYLHLQILSICSASQIRRMFQRRANSDLQRLLQGSDSVLRGLTSRLSTDMGMSFSSLVSLRVEASVRQSVSEAIVPKSQLKNILYTVIIAREKIVTLVRPRKQSIHPADLYILLNTTCSPSLKEASSNSSASWLPICLPKYNPDAFTHTYVSYLHPEVGLSLLCVCGSSDLEAVQGWADEVTQKMERDGTLSALTNAARQSEYTAAELGVAGLRHFVYKSKLHLQLTMPAFEDPYDDPMEQQRLINIYQIVHDSLHGRSGQEGQLKLQYIRTKHESVMGWVTQPFELYLTLSPAMSKSAAVNAANAVARWVRREEARLFIKDAPVF